MQSFLFFVCCSCRHFKLKLTKKKKEKKCIVIILYNGLHNKISIIELVFSSEVEIEISIYQLLFDTLKSQFL